MGTFKRYGVVIVDAVKSHLLQRLKLLNALH